MQNPNAWATYYDWTTGGNLRLGVPITDEFTIPPRYSLYESQHQDPEHQFAAVQRLLRAGSRA